MAEAADDLTGRLALVTGAGRGIGRAIAVGLAARGARVILTARSTDQLEAAVAAIRAAGGDAEAVPADLGSGEGREALLETVSRTFGRVDILVNNAASVAPLGESTAVGWTAWQDALVLDVVAPMHLSTALLPAMAAAGWGRIVNVSSGVVARPASMLGGNAYVTAKAALEAHTVNLAAEVAGLSDGVTVNAYRPGMVDTAMQEGIRTRTPDAATAGMVERFGRAFAEGRLISPEHSAAALLARLGGDDTGAIWSVDD